MILPLQDRLKRRFKVSPLFSTSNNTQIAVGQKFIFTLDERFIPYDDILMVNLSSEDCTIQINGADNQPLPRGNRANLDFKTIRQLAVVNNGTATITANQIKVNYRNTGHEGRDIISKGKVGLGALANFSIIRKFGGF